MDGKTSTSGGAKGPYPQNLQPGGLLFPHGCPALTREREREISNINLLGLGLGLETFMMDLSPLGQLNKSHKTRPEQLNYEWPAINS